MTNDICPNIIHRTKAICIGITWCPYIFYFSKFSFMMGFITLKSAFLLFLLMGEFSSYQLAVLFLCFLLEYIYLIMVHYWLYSMNIIWYFWVHQYVRISFLLLVISFSTACYSQVRIYNSYMIYNVFIIIILSIYREEFNLNKIINPINKWTQNNSRVLE